MRRLWIVVIVILAVFVLLVSGAVAFILFNPFAKPPATISKYINKNEVGIEQINFLFYNIKAYKLHNTPLSGNTPKIELVIGNEVYSSEIIKGNFLTKKESIEGEDLKIITSKEEFIKILNSGNLKQDLQGSVSEGKTEIEVLAGNTELLAKGYLALYKEITGKSLT